MTEQLIFISLISRTLLTPVPYFKACTEPIEKCANLKENSDVRFKGWEMYTKTCGYSKETFYYTPRL